jgi:hypothetical protein
VQSLAVREDRTGRRAIRHLEAVARRRAQAGEPAASPKGPGVSAREVLKAVRGVVPFDCAVLATGSDREPHLLAELKPPDGIEGATARFHVHRDRVRMARRPARRQRQGPVRSRRARGRVPEPQYPGAVERTVARSGPRSLMHAPVGHPRRGHSVLLVDGLGGRYRPGAL